MRKIDENDVTVETLQMALERAHNRCMDHHMRTKRSYFGLKQLRKRQVRDDCKPTTTTTPAPSKIISSLTNLGNVKIMLKFFLDSKFYLRISIGVSDVLLRCYHFRNPATIFQSTY